MATTRTLVRKNGMPVKRFWREKVTQKARDTYYTTTYPVYFTSNNHDTAWSLTDGAAPHSLDEAIQKARLLVESSTQPQTSATIYEMRAVYRIGTEIDYILYETEQRMQREREAAAKAANDAQRFERVRTTTSGRV